MDGSDVVDAVREEAATELDRLGSEKALVAETGAQLETGAVLEAAALAEARAAETFEAWAADEAHDRAASAFSDVAERETEHYDRIVAELDGEREDDRREDDRRESSDWPSGERSDPRGREPSARRAGEAGEPGDPDADRLHDYLRDLGVTVERTGAGLVGRPLAADRTLLQVVNFFVNEGDAARADLFRELRAETEALVDEGADLLDAVCETEADYERAAAAAVRAVEVVYEEYAATLEEMGLDPKPVC